VIIPAFEASEFIAETLASVFAQTYQEFEVIVVNDGSPDTPALESALAPWAQRVIYVTQPNGGPSRARNAAIERSAARYVAFLDSDDVWLPDFLAHQMRALDDDPRLDLIYSNGVHFGETALAGCQLMDHSPSRGRVTFDTLLSEACTVLTSCTVARRAAVVEAGGFDERFRRSEDYHLWLRLAFAGCPISYHHRVLVRHRHRCGSLSSDHLAMRQAFIDVLTDIDSRLPLTAGQRSRLAGQVAMRRAEIEREAAKDFLAGGRYADAADALGRASALHPLRSQRLRLNTTRAALALAPRLVRRLWESRRASRPAVGLTPVAR
jgi:glycosyltransferase involved in cell wall biosynthesis